LLRHQSGNEGLLQLDQAQEDWTSVLQLLAKLLLGELARQSKLAKRQHQLLSQHHFASAS
jgi:hypothetical protein